MKTLLKEKDIKLLKDFERTSYLYTLDDGTTVELHVYDLADNRIYSQHGVARSTYEIDYSGQGIVIQVPIGTGSVQQNTGSAV